MTLNLKAKIYTDETAARKHLEAVQWPDGPVCPHCDSKEVTRLTARPTSVRPGRPGLLKCRTCRKQFTVKVGTTTEAVDTLVLAV